MIPIRIAALALAAFVALGAAPAPGQDAPAQPQSDPPPGELSVEVGGAAMYPSRNIVENAANSKDHTTLVGALETAELVEILRGAGPFTVFAPVNKAFDQLPKGALDALLKPEGKEALIAVLTYHILPGKFSAADFVAAAKKGGGKAAFKTVEGEELTIAQNGRKLEIIDAKGDKSIVTILDVNQKNGVIHVVDKVLMPKT
jgi:uncharacterized surface protein with fasciclin (FAS1) repeats